MARKRKRSDITEQFFTAGELMEMTGDTSRIEGYAPDPPSPARWFAFAAFSAVTLFVIAVLAV